MNAALSAIKDGQATGAFFRALEKQAFEDRIAALEKRMARLEGKTASPGEQHESVKVVKEIVAKFYRVPVAALDDSTRWDDAVIARHAAMRLCWELLKLSPNHVGKLFNRGHGTTNHALRSLGDRLATDDSARANFEACRARVQKALGL